MKTSLLIATIAALVCSPAATEAVHPEPAPKPRNTQPARPEIRKHSKFLKQLLRDLARRDKTAGSSNGIARGDDNGDGFADLAIGIPSEDTPAETAASGAVVVIYGSANGLRPEGDTGVPAAQFWSQNSPRIPGTSEAGDRFGTALAAGEFNGDAFSDLAIGVPGEDLTVGTSAKSNAGRVVIIYGSPAGLAASGRNVVRASQSFDLFAASLSLISFAESVVPDNAGLGQSLAWGDFNGDTIGDLAIGAPNLAVKSSAFNFFADTESGGVWILYGSLGNGLETRGNQLATVLDIRETTGYHYGAALAGGDFNGDGVTDLAVGVPDQNIDFRLFGPLQKRAGAVAILPGRAGVGLDYGRGFQISQSTKGIPSDPLPNERFGFALAAGDFDGDGRAELAIGVPGQAGAEFVVNGNDASRLRDAGAVHVLRSSASGLLTTNSQYFDQTALFGSGNETGDAFGRALAAGDFNGDGRADLAIGVPREDVASVSNVGEVNVLYGSAVGLSTIAVRAPQSLRDSPLQTGAEFGRALSAWNFGRDEFERLPFISVPIRRPTADLAVGVPLKDVSGQIDAGAMHIFYGSYFERGLTRTGEQEITQESPGVPDSSEARDLFGSAGY